MERTKISLMTLLMAVMTVFSAAAGNVNGKAVKYIEVKNYFHKNTAPMPQEPLFTTQAEFDSQFSPAAFMGTDGQPTSLDFKHQAVVAIVLPETNRSADIKDVKLVKAAKNKLLLTYTVNYGQLCNYTTQPIYLMAIDGNYRKAKVEVKANIISEPLTMKETFSNVHYVNADRNIDISIDYPVTSVNGLAASVQNYESEHLSSMVSSFSNKMGTKRVAFHGDAGEFDRMLSFYTTMLVDSMNEVDKENAAPDRPCSELMKIMRTDENSDYITFEANGYSYMGGAHGLSIDNGITFNKTTGKQADIVKPSAELAKLIADKLPAEVKGYIESKPVPMPKNPAFIKDGKIIFLYQTGEIAANAAGAIRISFWPDEINKYLTDEGKVLSGISK